MCGICGAIRLENADSPPLSRGELIEMTDLMFPRGPDDRGVFEAPSMSIGVRRLSVIDIADGHQPFANESGSVWAAQNGELYNHRELRRQLVRDGHTLRTSCDTEIIPHLYEQHGPEFPRLLRGMFAIALWDGSQGRAVLVRDRLGVKPLYYSVQNGILWFASELKVLLGSGRVEPRIDPDGLDAYLSFGFVPGPMTLVSGVSKLQPGHRLVVDRGGLRDEPYWTYPDARPDETLDGPSASAALLELLEEAVVLRLMSDVPLGVMLSGGLDSSLIAALMARNMNEPLKTFSVGFAGGGSSNELKAAAFMAERLQADHHELELDPDAEVDLRELTWHLDEPVADLSALGFFQLSRLASSHVTVALSGQGADELFGGYSRHRAMAAIRMWNRLPAPELRRILTQRGPARLRQLDSVARMTPAARAAALKVVLPADRRASVSKLQRPDGYVDVAHEILAGLQSGRLGDPLAEMLYIDARLGLVDDMLHYFDRMSMAHSLEVRVPFLDHQLVEFAATVPPAYKVRHLKTKWILKKAAEGLVPDQIVNKPKIGFFNASVRGWMDRSLRGSVRDTLLTPNARYADYLDAGAVKQLVAKRPSERTRVDGEFLLAVTFFEHWLDSVFCSSSRRSAQASTAEVSPGFVFP